jgi:2-methylisocitrate lyase-like PEP mutase family enzyme
MTTDLADRFRALHHGEQPLLLANAWDGASARVLQSAGSPALATSSAAVAWSRGHADGGALPRADLLASLRDICRVCDVPVSVDLEDGYSDDPRAVAALAAEVAGAGAVGINLEDGPGDPAVLVAKIRAIRAEASAAHLFINARTDVLLRGLAEAGRAEAEIAERLLRYGAAGADGGFVPCLADLEMCARLAPAVPMLLLNLMALPGLPAPAALRQAGVRRISAGPAMFRAAYGAAERATRAFLAGDGDALFAGALDGGALDRALRSAAAR